VEGETFEQVADKLMDRLTENNPLEPCMQLAELEYIADSVAPQMSIADIYVELRFDRSDGSKVA
jgi:hypothetical protein